MDTTISDMNYQNKKILLVITKSNFGGAQKYVLELSKGLKEKGFIVQVAVGGEGILIDKLKNEGISVFQIPHLGRDVSLLNDIKTFFTLISIIRKNKPDIVHLNSSKIGGIGALAARICFIPKIIFTIHGWAFNEDRNFLSKMFIKILYLITILLSHNSIAVSEQTKNQTSSIPLSFLIKNKIKVVKNGINIPKFLTKSEAKDFISKKINLDITNKKIIGQIAELHKIKSIDTTIEAAKNIVEKYDDVIFIIIGEGQERENLENKINKYNLQDKFYLLGFIDNAAEYIKAFDIFCLTSKSEALALVLIESGLARVPVVASKVGGIPELITHNETGYLFESENYLDLQSKIENVLILEENKKTQITDNFYNKINNNFLIEHMVENTIKFY